MKRIMISLVALALIVLGLAVIPHSLPSRVGVQTAVRADTEKSITLDVALDCRTFNYSRGIPLDQIVRGDGFILNGKIFPAGTLRPGNDPNDPGSIGTYVSRGTSTATLAEHLANPESIGVFSTDYYLLNDGRALMSEGWFKPSGVGRAAVTGGMGAFSGASGEVSGVDISTNSTGCPNTRFTFKLKKQAPKKDDDLHE
jgi:hypothetical protein